MPKLDPTISGAPHTCAGCGRVMLRGPDGAFCECLRWRAQFFGGPMDGERGAYLSDLGGPQERLQITDRDDGSSHWYQLRECVGGVYLYDYVR